MGKGFDNHQLTAKISQALKALVLISLLLLRPQETRGFDREFELFDRGYEHYLAYRPERAVETFNTFLKEFPGSSAKDAALFWLGKSLIQVQSHEEAKRVLLRLKEELPESPLILYAEKELAVLSNAPPGGKEAVGEEKVRLVQREKEEAVAELDKLRRLLENEKKSAEDLKARVTELEKWDAESKALLARQEVDLKRADSEVEKLRIQLRDGKERQEKERFSKAQGPEKEAERREVRERSGREGSPAVRIRQKDYSLREIVDFVTISSSAMQKVGIRDVPWRNGNLYEDFINEQILHDEAKRAGVAADATKVAELRMRLKLSGEEAEYLARYLLIGGLIERKARDLPEERVVESLNVQYSSSDKAGKVNLAAELQARAKKGQSFEELAKVLADKVRYQVMRFDELQGWIKERIELLHDGEVSMVWTRDGYMILRPTMKRPSYRPFEEMGEGKRSEVRSFVAALLGELRKEIKDIAIIQAR